MSLVNILEFNDNGTLVKVEVGSGLVRITEGTYLPSIIAVTPEGLADIADAVEQHLEIESAAEYIDLVEGLY